jgi:hypothetical protein
LKMPWSANMYLRAVSDKIFELNFSDMNIRMKAETSPGAGDAELSVTSVTTNIKIDSTNGNIRIHGKTAQLLSDNDMTIRAGRFKVDPVSGETEVDTVGSMLFESSNLMKVFGWLKNTFSSSKFGAIQGAAPRASGFDKHPKDGVVLP